MKLGKLPPRYDSRTLKFSAYAVKLPPIPLTCAWGAGVEAWDMLGNDYYGDCAFAGSAHIEQCFSKANNGDFVPVVGEVLKDYSNVTGFNPEEPWTDQGTVLLDALNYWRRSGVCGGRKITAFTQVDHKNVKQLQAAIFLFGSAYVGVQLPKAISGDDTVWDKQRGAIEGGHCVCVVGYDQDYLIAISWGKIVKISYDWWLEYADEAWAVLSTHWYPSGLAPNHFNYAQLHADVAAFN